VADYESKIGSGTRAVASVSLEALKSLVSAYVSKHAFISYQPDAYKAAFYDRVITKYTQSAVGRPGMDVVREYVGNWKTWDVYSVSVMFLDVLEIARHRKPVPNAYAARVNAFSDALQRDAGFI
jgi:hypothetical protein